MKIVDSLRRWKNSNLVGLYIWNEIRRYREYIRFKMFSDESYVLKQYKKIFHKELNLKSPQTFTEKMQWLKVYYRNDLMSLCADKYAVREYVRRCGLGDILNPLIGVYDKVEQINYDILPKQFVLKGTHGSGWNIICKDKDNLDVKRYNRIMRSWLRQNIYYSGREWVYEKIPHRIVCEKYIDANGDDLRDYKFFCFSGEPKYIQVDGDRFVNHKRAYYDCNWEKMDFQYAGYDRYYSAEKPLKLNEMLEVAKRLSEPFPFSRIDLYNVGERVIFGEITFFPDAGFGLFEPEQADYDLGEMLKLPPANYHRK